MKNKKMSVIIAMLILTISIATLVTVIFAWFSYGDADGSEITIMQGDINLSAKVYCGNDVDKNGNLESKTTGTEVPFSPVRSENIAEYYQEVLKDTVTKHDEYAVGTYLTYKIVIENKVTNTTDAKVSINFDNLESYFYASLNGYLAAGNVLPPYATLSTLLGVNTARIMFQIDKLTARRYGIGATDINNGIAEGYGKLVATSQDSEAVAPIEKIAVLNTLTSSSAQQNDYNLLVVSNTTPFINEISLNKGELLEIDFRLYCKQLKEIMADYQAYASNYLPETVRLITEYNASHAITATVEQVNATARKYVADVQQAELQYIFDDQSSGEGKKLLQFTIKKIFITGRSVGGAVGGK